MARALCFLLALTSGLQAQVAKVIEKEGRVIVTKSGTKPTPAEIGVALVSRDRLGTGESSRAVLQMSERWMARVDEETDIEITPGAFGTGGKDTLQVALGGAFVYSREEEGELKITTPSATGGLRGTQLVVRVWPDGKTFMQVLEGQIELANAQGSVLLQSGEAGEAERGMAPRKTAVIETRNLLQWALYYPAVLTPEEFGLSADEQHALADSLEAYKQGDLLGALARWPAGYTAATDETRLYRAATLLATGRVAAARSQLENLPTNHTGRRAIERMLAAVQGTELAALGEPRSAGEAIAESYYQQSRRNLNAARDAARRATELAPQSGFAWTRLAELEFAFGRTLETHLAIEKGVALTPRNAQARALLGYVLSAENRITKARETFEAAIKLDGGLGNAWLGLGLTKIKQGRLHEGRADLQTAAVVEPTRAFLYSYHGKALNQEGKGSLALKDLVLAKELDPHDPTPWLYSAVQNLQENRYNAAIDDLQESVKLNDNRRVYRSRFLLDQDSAMRSANLARIYQNNGMTELAMREATRAVESDYTNSSAHLFLANSFDALRDPKRLLLRYETAWFNELLLTNLLAPVGGGPLSQFVSQQEYSKLLAADGPGGSVAFEWREDGYFDLRSSLYSTYGRLSTGFDYAYHHDKGNHANGGDERHEAFWQLKYEVTSADLFYALVEWKDEKTGDLLQSYNNQPGNPGLRYHQKNEPGLMLAGWNHRWGPGVHTLFLGGRLAAREIFSAPDTVQLLVQRNPAYLQPGFLRPAAVPGGLQYTSDILRTATTPPTSLNPDGTLKLSRDFQQAIQPFLGIGPVTGVFADRFDFFTDRKFAIRMGEIQHIWQASRNTLLLGTRVQAGPFDTTAQLDLKNPANAPLFTSPAALQHESVDFSRRSFYVYDFLNAAPGLTLIAGVSQDDLKRPENFRTLPVSSRQVSNRRSNPKLGFTYSPSTWITVRGAYTETLGGVTLDGNVRLEPVQIAGFNQAFRTIISESIVGSVEAPVYKNGGVSIEGMLPTRTWWSGSFSQLHEDVSRVVGSFDILTVAIFPHGRIILPAGTTEELTYREDVLTAGINQLMGDQFAWGIAYRDTRARLHDRFPQIPVALSPTVDQQNEASLREVSLTANWNSPSGWFVQGEGHWYSQKLDSMAGGVATPAQPGDQFWHINGQVGYRSHQNQREISIGVLNLTGRDYHLSPLTSSPELARQRTLFVRCRLSF